MSEVLKVMLVDDHEVVRKGIRALIEGNDDMEVVAEAESGEQAIDSAAIHTPDVIIMDIRMPDVSGVEACREIKNRFPGIQVVMLTSYSDDQALFESIMAGAAGFVLKQIRGNELVDAVRTVGSGKSLLDPDVTQRVLERLRMSNLDHSDPKLARLTAQEERVLELIAKGKTNREIGETIHLSPKTVKNYVSSILAKLEVTRRAEAASYITRAKAAKEKKDLAD